MNTHKIYSAPESDPNTENFIREIYEENEYNRFGIKIEPGDIVLDCGINVGIFTDYALDMGAQKVYSYEANEETFEHYKKNIISNPNSLRIGYNCASFAILLQVALVRLVYIRRLGLDTGFP